MALPLGFADLTRHDIGVAAAAVRDKRLGTLYEKFRAIAPQLDLSEIGVRSMSQPRKGHSRDRASPGNWLEVAPLVLARGITQGRKRTGLR